MKLDRRDLLKASAALGGALTLKSAGLLPTANAATGATPVIWLQGQSCTGCAVSFLNSIHYTTADDLLLNQLDVKFQSNVMAAAGDLAVEAATAARLAGGYVLILEGAIPFGDSGEFCHIWENTSMVDAVQQFAPGAIAIIALGTCASYGGIYAGAPNPTQARGVSATLTALGITKPVINIPGCPAHPDWLVGVVASLLNGQMPTLDSNRRPVTYFGDTVHSDCPNLSQFNSNYADEISTNHEDGRDSTTRACLACHSASDSDVPSPRVLGQAGCLYALNCKGRLTYGDCGVRKWNGGAANQYGQEWCVGAGSPCIGCTQPNFPDGMSPFFVGGTGGTGQTADTITVVRAEYHTSTRRLLIEATSSRQPQVTLTVTGQAAMTWVATANLYRLERTNVSQPSGNITVTSNLNGTASLPVTVVGTSSDTVTLTKAEYRIDTRQLTVEATSSGQPNATLMVTGYGQMTWVSAESRYRLQQTNVNQPSGAITVNSNQGGSATGAVTIIGGTTNDTVTVTLAEYRTATQELLVRATSSGQPNATLTVTGFGAMTWNSTASYYQLQRTGIAQPSSSTITVTSSQGGSASRTLSVVSTTGDTVTIILAQYQTSNRELLVRATSSRQPTAVLRVTGYGQMYWTSGGYYQMRKQNLSRPSTVTVTSSFGGSATAPVSGGGTTTNDTVTVTLAEYRTSTRELIVRATSTGQPNATLTVTGYGTMTWSSTQNYYQLQRTGIDQPSSSTVTVTSSLGGSGSRTVTVIGSTTTDTVRITRAEYDYEDRELVVEATSSRQPTPTLTVTNYGTMTWSSYRSCYRLRRTGVSRPSSVTVRSSLGGTATRSVTLDD